MMRRIVSIFIISFVLLCLSASVAYAAEPADAGEKNESTFLDSMLDTVFSGIDEDSDSYFAS